MKSERVLGGLVLALGILLFWATSDFPGAASNRPGPAFLPRLLAVLFGVCGVVFVIGLIPPEEQRPEVTFGGWGKGGILIVCLFLYIAVIKSVGFVIASTVLVAFVFLLVGNSVLTSLVATLILVPATYTLFSTVMGVVLPRGWLGW